VSEEALSGRAGVELYGKAAHKVGRKPVGEYDEVGKVWRVAAVGRLVALLACSIRCIALIV
jgi:hypothetical protein